MKELNSLPNDKVFDQSEFKAFADDNLVAVQMNELVFDGIENIVGKGENAGYQHFLLCPQYFQKASQHIIRRQNFRLVQIETNCRRHFKVHLKWKISVL